MKKQFISCTSDIELISRIFKRHKLNTKKIKLPVNKWTTEQTVFFFKRKEHKLPITFKRCSVFLELREIQIRTTLRYLLTPVRMTDIKKSDNRCSRMWERAAFIYSWWERKLTRLQWRPIWRFYKKIKNKTLYHLDISFQGIYQRSHGLP